MAEFRSYEEQKRLYEKWGGDERGRYLHSIMVSDGERGDIAEASNSEPGDVTPREPRQCHRDES